MRARSMVVSLASVVTLLAVAGPVAAQSFDLTGVWQDENGAVYTVRHVGGRVAWYMDGGARVKNVFVGTIAGSSITGEWFDLPSGELRNSGQLALRVESNQRMVKAGESQAYGGSVWTRRGATAAGPQPGQVAYAGCFKDQGDSGGTAGRDLNGAVWNDGRMTTEGCVAFCQQRGFTYAGTQYSNWCFCGNSYGRSGGANNCDMRCGGNASQTCGGTWANSVYQIR